MSSPKKSLKLSKNTKKKASQCERKTNLYIHININIYKKRNVFCIANRISFKDM